MRLNIRLVWINIFSLIIFIVVSGCSKTKTIEIGKTTLEHDTTWQGNILVTGDVYVPPNVTLTVLPGTVVKFKRIDETSDQNLFDIDSPYYPQAEIIVRGKLIAKGTKKKRVVFTSAEMDARPADWGAINFLGSEGNVIEHAKILCAYNGIHAHGSSAQVSHSEFIKNGVGISFKKEEETPGVPWFGKSSNLTITNNLFAGNKGGIGFRNSNAVIKHNEVRDNKFFGIWPKENTDALISHNEVTNNKKGIYLYQARGVKLNDNNIYDNRDYNIAVAEAQDFPIDASNNWFGSLNEQKIAEMIFDKKDDPELGEITYIPYRDSPVAWRKH